MFFHQTYNISIWRPKGKIEMSSLVLELESFADLEKSRPPFNRFTDFSNTDVSGVRFEEIKQIYWLRKTDYKGPPVKSVFYVISDLQFGVVRMYQALMSSTQIEVEICRTKSECSLALGVPEAILFDTIDPEDP